MHYKKNNNKTRKLFEHLFRTMFQDISEKLFVQPGVNTYIDFFTFSHSFLNDL